MNRRTFSKTMAALIAAAAFPLSVAKAHPLIRWCIDTTQGDYCKITAEIERGLLSPAEFKDAWRCIGKFNSQAMLSFNPGELHFAGIYHNGKSLIVTLHARDQPGPMRQRDPLAIVQEWLA